MAQKKSFERAEEFAALDFHSIRLEERFIRTMETLIEQPDKSIWEASGYGTKYGRSGVADTLG